MSSPTVKGFSAILEPRIGVLWMLHLIPCSSEMGFLNGNDHMMVSMTLKTF
jgi:hypothetical protein